jgi:long-chain fatty acid transport protein
MARHVLLVGLLGLTISAAPQLAFAQGSAVYTHSACNSARNGAGVAQPCADGSAIFYNPAALATLPGVVGLGVTAIRTENTFVYDDGRVPPGEAAIAERGPTTTPVPHFYAAHRVNERLAAGFGIWAPYGLGIEWPLAFSGRYVSYDTELRGIYLQPTLAYQVVPGMLSIGAGVDFVRGSVAINQRQDLAPFGMPGVDFVDVGLTGDAWGTTAHVGIQAILTPQLSLGARYLHSVRLDFDDATATFEQVPTNVALPAQNPFGVPAGTPLDVVLAAQFVSGGPLSEQRVATEIELPAQAVIGLAFRALPELTLLADYQWYGWSSWDAFPLAFERAPDTELILEYEDAHVIRVGAEFAVSPAMALRGGVTYNTAAAPDATVTPMLPENDRLYLSFGMGYNFMPNLTGDFFVMHVNQGDRAGRVRGRTDRAQTADQLNVGHYTSNALLGGITVSYRFGPAR